MLALAVLALVAQGGLPDSVLVTGEPSLTAAFHGRPVHYFHLTPLHQDSVPRHISRGEPLGTIQDRPARLSQRYHDTIVRARGLYAQGRYPDAAALLAPAYANEPDNRFLMDEYARTLYWVSGRRDESFALYRKLIEDLDRQYGMGDTAVAVDAWFLESYWKIGNLYLDRAEWERAAFEMTRSASLGDRPNAALNAQFYTYLAEAYVHLNRPELARWSAQRALRYNPRSVEALGHLYELGSRARAWGPTHVFACRVSTDTLPCVGGYSFRRDASVGVTCVAPREDPPTRLSPCLRIGWVYVGETRSDIEAELGAPFRQVPTRGDGTEGMAYLVFADSVQDSGSYYVIEYERVGPTQVARSIQFTGDATPLPLDFSGLLLGDASERVLRQLGAPRTRGDFNDEDLGLKGEWWDWTAAPISLEIVGGRLYSVRLWRPDDVPAQPIARPFSRFR